MPSPRACAFLLSAVFVAFLDGPMLQEWKATCREFHCHETDMALGVWLGTRSTRIARLVIATSARYFSRRVKRVRL